MHPIGSRLFIPEHQRYRYICSQRGASDLDDSRVSKVSIRIDDRAVLRRKSEQGYSGQGIQKIGNFNSPIVDPPVPIHDVLCLLIA